MSELLKLFDPTAILTRQKSMNDEHTLYEQSYAQSMAKIDEDFAANQSVGTKETKRDTDGEHALTKLLDRIKAENQVKLEKLKSLEVPAQLLNSETEENEMICN